MIRRIILLIPLITLLMVSVFLPRVYAETNSVVTDTQLAKVKQYCTEITGTLQQLQQSDVVLRHDRSELYQTISNKLMTPLNQRIATNQLDGSELVKTTADFTAAYKTFYEAYQSYDTSMTETLNIDCSKQPATFYDQLAETRDERAKLHIASAKLVELAEQYKQQFDTFKSANATGGAVSE